MVVQIGIAMGLSRSCLAIGRCGVLVGLRTVSYLCVEGWLGRKFNIEVTYRIPLRMYRYRRTLVSHMALPQIEQKQR
jgi:hypothetical protein